jgi:hypothetical protein
MLTRKRRRDLPWEFEMTLCIAAASRENDQPRIVLAADLRVEKDWIGAEIAFKLSWLTKDWPALFAGKVASARQVINVYATALAGVELNESNIYDELKRPAERHKLALCEHHVRMKLGMSYSDFINHGKESLSEAVFQETEFEVRKLDLECDLITCGFPPSNYPSRHHAPQIFTIAADGEVCHHDTFAAIGTGSVIAESVLYQRRLTENESLERTVYVVYEAMKSASIAPSVGKLFHIVIFGPGDTKSRMLSLEGYKHHDELMKVYAPKKLGEMPALSDGLFMTIGETTG